MNENSGSEVMIGGVRRGEGNAVRRKGWDVGQEIRNVMNESDLARF